MTVNDPAGVNWQVLFFDPESGWPKRLQAQARRRFGGSEDADAAYNFALDEISKDDWRRLKDGFKGRGSAGGFLAVTLANLLEEYAVRKYGKKRPPVWVSRLGTVWKRVHQMLCLQRLAPETIVDVLTARTEHRPDDVRYAIQEVRRRVPNCGEYVGERNLSADDDMDLRVDDALPPPPQELANDQFAQVIDLLRHMVGAEASVSPRTDGPTATALTALRACLSVSTGERLLLKLIYHEGYSVPRAAKSLMLHEQKARRAHKALLHRLQQCLIDHGF